MAMDSAVIGTGSATTDTNAGTRQMILKFNILSKINRKWKTAG